MQIKRSIISKRWIIHAIIQSLKWCDTHTRAMAVEMENSIYFLDDRLYNMRQCFAYIKEFLSSSVFCLYSNLKNNETSWKKVLVLIASEKTSLSSMRAAFNKARFAPLSHLPIAAIGRRKCSSDGGQCCRAPRAQKKASTPREKERDEKLSTASVFGERLPHHECAPPAIRRREPVN